jgi:hypothetical protein
VLSHTVLFRLRRPLDPQQLAAFITELSTFAAQASPSAGPITIGANIGIRDPADARVADVSW